MSACHPPAKRRLGTRSGPALLALVYLLQALIPAGFMPGALASGQIATLCPSGIAPYLLQSGAESGSHQHHHPASDPADAGAHSGHPHDRSDGARNASDANAPCALGGASTGTALLTETNPVGPASLGEQSRSQAADRQSSQQLHRPQQARAPPTQTALT